MSNANDRYAGLFQRAGVQQVIVEVRGDIDAMQAEGVSDYLLSCVPEEVLWHPDAGDLRERLAPIPRVSRAVEVGKAQKLSTEVIYETAAFANQFKKGIKPRTTFWNWARYLVEVDGFLWDIASAELRANLLKEKRTTIVSTAPQAAKPTFKARTAYRGTEHRAVPRASPPAPRLSIEDITFAEDVLERVDWAIELKRKPIAVVVRETIASLENVFSLFGVPRSLIPDQVLLHEDARHLRASHFALDSGVYRDLAGLPDATDEQLEEVVSHFNGAVRHSPGVVAPMWVTMIANSPHQSWLRAHETSALEKVRQNFDPNSVLSEQDAQYIASYKEIPKVAYRLSSLVSFSARSAYGRTAGELTNDDWQLAEAWAEGANGDSEIRLAQMVSARAAERVAMRFYSRLGYRVEDVAIQQLKNSPEYVGWKTHDLVAAGRPVDVKNARPRNHHASYAEHIVKRFKVDARDQDVTVLGVRSPFLQLQYLEDPQSIPLAWRRRVEPVVVLGEFTRSTWNELRREFTRESDTLDGLSIDRGDGGGEYLPPWVFTFPEVCYRRGGYDLYRGAVARVVSQPPPAWKTLVRRGLNLLPYYVQSSTPLPESWRQSLSTWMVALSEEVSAGRARESLPHLFLTVLTDFLEAIREQRQDFNPLDYHQLLYSSVEAEPDRFTLPLGILDPLQSVYKLVDTLVVLWTHRSVTRIHEFTRFRFSAAGLLRGTREGDSSPISLLAWCGSCRRSPLVLGKEEACNCGYLICSCGFCSLGCEEGVSRQRGRDADHLQQDMKSGAEGQH